MQATQKCYGKMFPDLSVVKFNIPLKGKAFNVLVSSGGMGISDRAFSADAEEWARCTECPEFEHCYQFSMAQLSLHTAVQRFGISPAL